MSRMIKSKIVRGEPVGEECFMFNLPDETEHRYHLVGVESVESIDSDEADQKYHIVEDDYEVTEVENGYELTELENNYEVTKVDNKYEVTEVEDEHEQISSTGPDMGDYIECSLVDESKPNPVIPYISEVPLLKTTEKQNELPVMRRDRTQLLTSCKSSIISIESTIHYLDEGKLETLSKILNDLYLEATKEVRTEKITTNIPIKPCTPASSTRDNQVHLLSLKQEDNERVIAAGMYQSSGNIEIDEESAVQSNNLKRKKKSSMILIKRKKDDHTFHFPPD